MPEKLRLFEYKVISDSPEAAIGLCKIKVLFHSSLSPAQITHCFILRKRPNEMAITIVDKTSNVDLINELLRNWVAGQYITNLELSTAMAVIYFQGKDSLGNRN